MVCFLFYFIWGYWLRGLLLRELVYLDRELRVVLLIFRSIRVVILVLISGMIFVNWFFFVILLLGIVKKMVESILYKLVSVMWLLFFGWLIVWCDVSSIWLDLLCVRYYFLVILRFFKYLYEVSKVWIIFKLILIFMGVFLFFFKKIRLENNLMINKNVFWNWIK